MNADDKPTILNYLSPVAMISLSAWHYLRHGLDMMAVILMGLGGFSLYLVLFNHCLLRRVLVLLTKLWYPIGQAITFFLFIITFYIVFTPVGLLLRLLRKDILGRDFKNVRPSYWIDRKDQEVHNYTQQF